MLTDRGDRAQMHVCCIGDVVPTDVDYAELDEQVGGCSDDPFTTLSTLTVTRHGARYPLPIAWRTASWMLRKVSASMDRSQVAITIT